VNAVAVKARRQQAILELVRSRSIGSQEQLAEALRERGHGVAQSTLSRDLKELRVLRVPVGDGYRYFPAGEEEPAPAAPVPLGLGRISAAEVVRVEANEAVAVVQTQIGRAQGVAFYLDGLQLPGVLATVAGDDTVLVVPTSVERTGAVKRRLTELFGLS
jgi:transcriptional regulator of arginine metabolism